MLKFSVVVGGGVSQVQVQTEAGPGLRDSHSGDACTRVYFFFGLANGLALVEGVREGESLRSEACGSITSGHLPLATSRLGLGLNTVCVSGEAEASTPPLPPETAGWAVGEKTANSLSRLHAESAL